MQNAFPIVCGVFFGSLMVILSKITQVNKNSIIKALDILARTSYPIYLFHIIVIGLMKFSGDFSIWGFLISIHVFAIVFHYAFEYQLLSNRPKYPKY
jgi:peptidoglycan/LPS O-acetylase OafA/YrhL